MYTKIVVALALAQVAFSQYIAPKSTVTGNSVVNNDIFINGGNYGLAAAPGLIGVGPSVGIGSGLGIGSGIGIGSGLGVASGAVVGGLAGLNVGSSGPLVVTTISPIGPSGLAVVSENAIAGNLAVSGQLPFLSAVAFEGALPTAGSGLATCGCGSGAVGIVSEGFPTAPAVGVGSGLGIGSGLGMGLNAGLGVGRGGLLL